MKTIQLSVDQARELYQKDNSLRTTLLHQFTDEELGIKPPSLRWENLNNIEGCYIDRYSSICEMDVRIMSEVDKNINTSKQDCLKQLAECQLRQLAKFYNDGQTEEEWIDWGNTSQLKYYICYTYANEKLSVGVTFDINHSLVYFKRKEDAKKCLADNVDLFKQYFKISE